MFVVTVLFRVRPDAVTSAKALAGGLPMGALLAREEAAGAFEPGDHASTFGGGPLVASVADAVLQVILADGFLEEVRAKGRLLRERLEAVAGASGLVDHVRGRGLMQGVVLTEPRAAEVTADAAEAGLLVCPAGADVVRLVPPLVITPDEIDEAVGILGAVVAGTG